MEEKELTAKDFNQGFVCGSLIMLVLCLAPKLYEMLF